MVIIKDWNGWQFYNQNVVRLRAFKYLNQGTEWQLTQILQACSLDNLEKNFYPLELILIKLK